MIRGKLVQLTADRGVDLVIVHNPFDRRSAERTTVPWSPEWPLSHYVETMSPSLIVSKSPPLPVPQSPCLPVSLSPSLPVADFAVFLNGVLVPPDRLSSTYPRPGQQITCVPVMEGQTGIEIAFVLAAAAAVIFLGPENAVIAGWGTGAMSSGAAGLVGMGVMAAGALAANMLFPVPKPATPEQDTFYGWSPQTVQQQGLPVPRWYGYNKIYGNVIDAFTTVVIDQQRGGTELDQENLYMLLDLGIGPWESITSERLQDEPIGSFASVSTAHNMGLMRQAPLPGFSVTKAEYPVGVQVFQGSFVGAGGNVPGTPQPYTYTTQGNAFDSLEVDVSLPAGIFGANADGYFTSEVDFTISYGPVGGPQTQLTAVLWKMCRATAIVRTFAIPGPLPHGVYTITLSKGSIDHYNGLPTGDYSWGDALYMATVREVYWADLSYPRHVQTAISALATGQISGSLRYSCYAECLKVRNTDDGVAWSTSYSNNPAWVALDILIQPVYDNALNVMRYDGVDPSFIDVPAFLACAAYCNELVPDGAAGTEPRATFNGGFAKFTDPWTAANQVLSLARSHLVLRGTQYSIVTDCPRTVTDIVTMADMEPGSYRVDWLPLANRAARIDGVNFVDSSNDFKPQPISQVNGQVKSNFVTASIDLTGVTKWSEAWRILNYHLACNQYLLRSHAWKEGTEGILAMPGDLIELQDEVTPMGASGKAVSGTASTVTLDTPVEIDGSGAVYMIVVRHSTDGTLEHMTVTSAPGTYETISIGPATWREVPAQYDAYAFGKGAVYLKTVQLVTIEGDADQGHTIAAIDYDPSIYGLDYGTPAGPIPTGVDQNTLPPVTGLTAKELIITPSGAAPNDYIDLYWSNPSSSYYAGADVWYTTAGAPWTHADRVPVPAGTYRLQIYQTGAYTIAVCTINVAGQITAPADAPSVSVTAVGKVTPPANPVSLSVAVNASGTLLSWPSIPSPNIAGYVLTRGGTQIAAIPGTSYQDVFLSPGTYTYSLVAQDYQGNVSAIPATLSVTILAPNTPIVTDVVSTNDNSVTFSWPDAKTTYPIDHYLFNGVSIGSARTHIIPITWTGTVLFTVQAVDVAGNASGACAVSVTISTLAAPSAIVPTGKVLQISVAVTYTAIPTLQAVELWGGEVNNRDNCQKIGEVTASTQTGQQTVTFLDAGLAVVDTHYYWARLRDVNGNVSSWYPSSNTAGIAGQTSTNPADYLTLLTGAITSSQLVASLSTPIAEIEDQSYVYTPDAYEAGVYATIKGETDRAGGAADKANAAITSLQASSLTQLAEIQSLDSQIAALTSAPYSSAVSYSPTGVNLCSYQGVVYQCILANPAPSVAPPSAAYWQVVPSVVSIVGTVQAQVDALTGEISSMATEVEVNSLSNTVSALGTTVTQQASEIALTATQTSVSALSSLLVKNWSASEELPAGAFRKYTDGNVYECIQAITFTPAPPCTNAAYWELAGPLADQVTSDESSIQVNAGNISLVSSAVVGTVPYLTGVYEDGVYVQGPGDVKEVDNRISNAQVEIDGANATIALQAAAVDNLTGRMASAELEITNINEPANGLQAQIDQKVSVEAFDAGQASNVTAIAAAQESITALRSTDGLFEAQWAVKLDANGHIAGVGLLLQSTGLSEFDIIANVFRLINPSAPGATPVVPFQVGTVNGQTIVGIDGSLVIDGSILATAIQAGSIGADRLVTGSAVITGTAQIADGIITDAKITSLSASKITATTLSAIAANLGTITAGIAQNAAGTNFVNFNASGSAVFLQIGSQVVLNADGTGTFARPLVGSPNIVASGTPAIDTGVLSVGGTASYTIFIDTGVNFNETWYGAPSDHYCAVANFGGGNSWNGGAKGYTEVSIVHGDGLYTDAYSGGLIIDDRIYIKVVFSLPGTETGSIQFTELAWKLIRI